MPDPITPREALQRILTLSAGTEAPRSLDEAKHRLDLISRLVGRSTRPPQPAAALPTTEIVGTWVVDVFPAGDAEPVVDLATLPGWVGLADRIVTARAEPQWSWTPEGHDDCYEYVRTADCDGSDERLWRRTPRRTYEIPMGRQEAIDALPLVARRRLVDAAPGEEPRP